MVEVIQSRPPGRQPFSLRSGGVAKRAKLP